MFKSLANAIRFLAIDQVGQANSGHLGSSLGISDCLTVLFKNFLVFDPENPFWPNRDRFVLSGGHNSAALYAVLHLVGYDNISINELKNFRCLGSKTSGHPEYDIQSGIEISTGPLGWGSPMLSEWLWKNVCLMLVWAMIASIIIHMLLPERAI